MIEMTAADLSDKNAIDWNVINGSSIGISMDVTNQHIAFTLQLKFVEAFQQVLLSRPEFSQTFVENRLTNKYKVD